MDQDFITKLKKQDRLNIFNLLIEWMDKAMRSAKGGNSYEMYATKSKVKESEMFNLIAEVDYNKAIPSGVSKVVVGDTILCLL